MIIKHAKKTRNEILRIIRRKTHLVYTEIPYPMPMV